jgi:hypothetical protein
LLNVTYSFFFHRICPQSKHNDCLHAGRQTFNLGQEQRFLLRVESSGITPWSSEIAGRFRGKYSLHLQV